MASTQVTPGSHPSSVATDSHPRSPEQTSATADSALSAADSADITAIAAAEAAWLSAWGSSDRAGMRLLMHSDCLVVHGPLGHQSGPEEFLAYNKSVGPISEALVHDVVTRPLGGVIVVSCLQESRIMFVPDVTPFVIQAAVTRVWAPVAGTWLLAHMHMARRQPPG